MKLIRLSKKNQISEKQIQKLLSECNMTYAQLKQVSPQTIKENIKKREENEDELIISENAPLEDRILFSGIYIMEIKEMMESYARLLINTIRMGPDTKYLCDPEEELVNELIEKWDMLLRISKGIAGENDIKIIAGFISRMPANRKNCLIAALTGIFVRIDILLAIAFVVWNFASIL